MSPLTTCWASPTTPHRRTTAQAGPVVVAEAAPLYSPESRHIEVVELAAAAGLGAEVYDETVVSRLAFRQDWLAERGIDAAQCNVIRVAGDSMEPTLPDGCSILVDRSRREPREDQVFVLQTEDGLGGEAPRQGRERPAGSS